MCYISDEMLLTGLFVVESHDHIGGLDQLIVKEDGRLDDLFHVGLARVQVFVELHSDLVVVSVVIRFTGEFRNFVAQGSENGFHGQDAVRDYADALNAVVHQIHVLFDTCNLIDQREVQIVVDFLAGVVCRRELTG